MEKNKVTTYLLYAVGEIFLVVIGILIAVSLNNWNENKKNLKAEQGLLTKVLSDLETDAALLEKNQQTAANIVDLHQDCFAIILAEKRPEDVELKNPNLIRRTMYYVPVTRENHPDLINRVIDEEIKEEAARYYHWMTMTDELYDEFENVVNLIRRTISLKNGHNLSALYQKSSTAFNTDKTVTLITRESILRLLEDPYMQQLLVESNLKLLDNSGSLDSLVAHNQKLSAMIREKLTP